MGLALGVYIVVISISGSAVVLRPQFHRWATPHSVAMEGTRLTADALQEAIRRVYSPHEVAGVREQPQPDAPVVVRLQREGVVSERLFDPYAVRDLGLSYPPILHFVEGLVDLHDNFLAGDAGRVVNGVAALFVIALALTGLVIWWPGKDRWRHSLLPGKPARSRRFAQRLHNALGIWTLVPLLIWAFTGAYFVFPGPVEHTLDFLDDDPTDFERPGEAALLLLVKLHFGRFGGVSGRLLWIALGLLPAVLFVTGFIPWWARILSARRRAAAAGPPPQTAAAGKASPATVLEES